MSKQALLDEIRALQRAFVRSGLRSCHVVTDTLDIFMSRDRAFTAGAGQGTAELPAEEPPVVAVMELTAPHLGTLIALDAVGSDVAAGAAYGALAVLDEQRDLIAAHGGRVVAHLRAPGALVEFGHPLIALAG